MIRSTCESLDSRITVSGESDVDLGRRPNFLYFRNSVSVPDLFFRLMFRF